MPTDSLADPLRAYLETLVGHAPSTSFIELRVRVADDILASEFVPVRETDRAAAIVRRRGNDTDVYVGCAPRIRRSGKRRDIDQLWVLWAECDGAAAAHAAYAYRPAPAIVVASGTGPNVHAYWPLREPVDPREAEGANLRLALALGADRACFDATRILRPPDSWNHKRRPPRPVRALRFVDRRFDVEDVIALAPPVASDSLERRWRRRDARDTRGDELLEIAPAVYVSMLLRVDARPGRKVACPFHADEHPSLHVYPTSDGGWSCFSCRRGGSIYDLAAALWGTGTRGREFSALRQRLRNEFAMELSRRAGLER